MNDNIQEQHNEQNIQQTDSMKPKQIEQPMNWFHPTTKRPVISPMIFYAPRKELQVEDRSQNCDFIAQEPESQEIKPQIPERIERQEPTHNEMPYMMGFTPKQEMKLAEVSTPSSPMPVTGPLSERLKQMGILKKAPAAIQPSPSATAFELHPVSASRKEGPTSMSLLNKVKACRAICVKDHKVYLFKYGCYMFMSQSDMEEEIWSICEMEIRQVGNRSIISGAYQLMTIDPSLRVENLHSAQNLVPFRNGLLCLDDGSFLWPSPMYFVTFTLNCDYPLDPSTVACTAFEKYLQDVSGGDILLIARIWEFLGYCLTQDVNAKAIFVLQGITNSGKSVLTNLIKAFFPRAVLTALDAHDMGEKFAIGECEDKAICICSDMPAEALGSKAVSNMKKLSGRDTISSAVKYQNRKEFVFTGKIMMVTNNPLLLKQDDQAFWERIVAIPFRYQIPREQRIDNLEDRLAAEMPAIASRALMAYFILRNNHYRFSGNFEINDQDMYADASSMVADPATMVFMYLQRFYEPWPDHVVILEEACDDFNRINGTSMSRQQFSMLFCKQADSMYGAKKKRSREGGYENPRSAVSGIKRKFI